MMTSKVPKIEPIDLYSLRKITDDLETQVLTGIVPDKLEVLARKLNEVIEHLNKLEANR